MERWFSSAGHGEKPSAQQGARSGGICMYFSHLGWEGWLVLSRGEPLGPAGILEAHLGNSNSQL